MSKDYEEFMSSQEKKEKVTDIKTTEINKYSDDKRLDLILKKLENNNQITILENTINLGAGESLKKLISYLYNKNYHFLIKVDGDDQFLVKDVQKILQI